MTELQAELILKQAAHIEKLEAALRAIANDDDKTWGMVLKIARAALANPKPPRRPRKPQTKGKLP